MIDRVAPLSDTALRPVKTLANAQVDHAGVTPFEAIIADRVGQQIHFGLGDRLAAGMAPSGSLIGIGEVAAVER